MISTEAGAFPAFESGEITDADPELGSEFLLRQAPIDS
jgi:hypothetical protein